VATKPNSKGKATRRPYQAQAPKDPTPGADASSLTDLLRALLEPSSAITNFHALALKQWLAPWVIFMRAYRETLDESAATLSPEDRSRRFLKALMAAYLEFEKSTLDQRSFLAAQRELLDTCLLTAEGFLRTTRPSGK
jgi:hypothetical protein